MLIQRLSNHTVNQFSRFTGERVPAASGQLFYAVAQVVGVISAPACNPHSHDWPRVFVYARSCAPGVTDLCIWIYGAAIRIAERCTTAARATEMGEQGGDKKTKNNKAPIYGALSLNSGGGSVRLYEFCKNPQNSTRP